MAVRWRLRAEGYAGLSSLQFLRSRRSSHRNRSPRSLYRVVSSRSYTAWLRRHSTAVTSSATGSCYRHEQFLLQRSGQREITARVGQGCHPSRISRDVPDCATLCPASEQDQPRVAKCPGIHGRLKV